MELMFKSGSRCPIVVEILLTVGKETVMRERITADKKMPDSIISQLIELSVPASADGKLMISLVSEESIKVAYGRVTVQEK